jgi:hypothetical protein
MIPVRALHTDVLRCWPNLERWCALHELQRTNRLLKLSGAHRTGKVAKLIDLYARLNSGGKARELACLGRVLAGGVLLASNNIARFALCRALVPQGSRANSPWE